MFKHRLLIAATLLACTLVSVSSEIDSASRGRIVDFRLERAQKVWDQGSHNAFTDLVRHRGKFYCVFREAEGHVTPEADIRILASKDGWNWESTGLLTLKGIDLRDPKISVTPDGRLMVLGGAAERTGHEHSTSHRSFVSFSSDGRDWGPLEWVAGKDRWLWRVTWHEGKAYGVTYDCALQNRQQRSYATTLYVSEDGTDFTVHKPSLFTEGGPNEATLRFAEDGTCYCLQRRDGRDTRTALLGTSKPPYQEWSWKDLDRYFGGPNFIQVPGGSWIAGGRFMTGDGARTTICQLDVEGGELISMLTLPSGGDTSYPGMLWHDGRLWISYYASHEGKTSIYIATLEPVYER